MYYFFFPSIRIRRERMIATKQYGFVHTVSNVALEYFQIGLFFVSIDLKLIHSSPKAASRC
jgi:hypothetical protein